MGKKRKESGSALLITTLLLMMAAVMLGAVFNMSDMAYKTALTERYSSNNYYMARAGIERHIQNIELMLSVQLPKVIEDIKTEALETALLTGSQEVMAYSKDSRHIQISQMREMMLEKIYTLIQLNFVNQPVTYKVQSDTIDKNYFTEITVNVSDKDSNNSKLKSKNQFRIIASLKTVSEDSSIFDKQSVEAVVEISAPEEIMHQVNEKFEYQDEELMDIVNQALLCFSDVVIGSKGTLTVLSGDVRVKGTKNINTAVEEKVFNKCERNGGIITREGGSLLIYENLYCMNSLLAVGSENKFEKSQIQIEGEAVAKAVGILDKEAGQYFMEDEGGALIKIKQSALVDHQVVTEGKTGYGDIQIGKTLFLLNEEEGNTGGVFAVNEHSNIMAERMYIMKQPYLSMDEIKAGEAAEIWEAGETLEGHQLLLNQESRIQGIGLGNLEIIMNGRRIHTDMDQSYGLADVAIKENTDGKSDEAVISPCAKATFKNEEDEAERFFYQGSSDYAFSEFVSSNNEKESWRAEQNQKVIENLAAYYKGEAKGSRRKIIEKVIPQEFRGLKGYMTIKRAIFYKSVTSKGVQYTCFKDLIDRQRLPGTLTASAQDSWSYETPVCITNGGEIDISQFYKKSEKTGDEPCPTIIINYNGQENQTTNKLKLKAGTRQNKSFRGIIISEGAVEITDDLQIDGVVIIGGPEAVLNVDTSLIKDDIHAGEYAGLVVQGGNVTISFNPQWLLEIDAQNSVVYQDILDALHLTNYLKSSSASQITNPGAFYTKQPLDFTEKTFLTADAEHIGLNVMSIKKING